MEHLMALRGIWTEVDRGHALITLCLHFTHGGSWLLYVLVKGHRHTSSLPRFVIMIARDQLRSSASLSAGPTIIDM